MPDPDLLAANLPPHLSRGRLRDLLQALVRVPSPVAPLLEAEPLLRAFITASVMPRLEAIGGEAIAAASTSRPWCRARQAIAAGRAWVPMR